MWLGQWWEAMQWRCWAGVWRKALRTGSLLTRGTLTGETTVCCGTHTDIQAIRVAVLQVCLLLSWPSGWMLHTKWMTAPLPIFNCTPLKGWKHEWLSSQFVECTGIWQTLNIFKEGPERSPDHMGTLGLLGWRLKSHNLTLTLAVDMA